MQLEADAVATDVGEGALDLVLESESAQCDAGAFEQFGVAVSSERGLAVG